MPPKPICRQYAVVATSLPGGAFASRFDIPGKDAQTLHDRSGRVVELRSADEAQAIAGVNLCAALNGRTRSSVNNYGWKVMGGADLAVALNHLDLSPTNFAMICGTDQRRVMDWIDGVAPIPRTVNLIVHLIGQPGITDVAKAFTENAMFVKPRPPSPA